MTELLLVLLTLGPALLIRACRPGPVPPWRPTWFDVVALARSRNRKDA